MRGLASGLDRISIKLTEFWAQDAGMIGKATVAVAKQCADE